MQGFFYTCNAVSNYICTKYLNMHKIKALVAAIVLMIAMHGTNAQDLFIKLKSGTTQQIALNSIRNITYIGNTMNVKLKSGTTQSWNVFDIDYYAYQAPTAIGEVVSNQNTFSIYPNPVADKLHVSFEFDNEKEYAVDICNLNGSNVKHFDLGKLSPATKTVEVPIHQLQLPAGTYVCNLKSGNKILSQQFIKQ